MKNLDKNIYSKLYNEIRNHGFITKYYLNISTPDTSTDFDGREIDTLLDLLRLGLAINASMLLSVTHENGYSSFATFIK